MRNPVLTPQRWQAESVDAGQVGWAAPHAAPGDTAAGGGAAFDLASVGAPAGVHPAKVMTIGGTMSAAGVLFVLLLATGVFGWSQVSQTSTVVETLDGPQTIVNTNFPGWLFLPMIGALVLALVTVFRPPMARFTAPLYALTYGITLGAISHAYDLQYNGIVLQAVGATLGVFTVMLLLYATRIIKVTQRYVIGVIAATGGIFLLYMVTWIASIFGAHITFWNDPTPLGIGISVVVVIVAAMNLGIDFAFIEQASKAGAPRYMEWFGAFGLMVTLIWLYLEILRLLSLLNRR